MPVLDFNNKEEVKEYEDFILNHVGTSFMQDLNWGKVKYNWKQEAVYLKEDLLLSMHHVDLFVMFMI